MGAAASKCCRSTPRCAGCPVLVARRRRTGSAVQELFADILLGERRSPPAVVVEQLELLDRARRRPSVTAQR